MIKAFYFHRTRRHFHQALSDWAALSREQLKQQQWMHHHRRWIHVDWLHNWRYATEPTCEWALYILLQGTELSGNSICVGLKQFFCIWRTGAAAEAAAVVIDGGLTPVKIFFRLRLQNLSPGVCPPSVADGRWLAVVLCCVCLRVMAMVSMSARCSKGNGYGFNVGALF